MSKPRIGIVISTTRMGRFADKPVEWLWNLVSRRTDMEFEIVDLRRYPLPFFDEPMSPAWGAPKNEVARRWEKKVAELEQARRIRRLWRRRRRAISRTAPPDQHRVANGAVARERAHRRDRIRRHVHAREDVCRLATPGAGGPRHARRARLVGAGIEGHSGGDAVTSDGNGRRAGMNQPHAMEIGFGAR
jgi:hypothetical protein